MFNRRAARAAGYTDAEIDAYMKQRGLQEMSTETKQVTPDQSKQLIKQALKDEGIDDPNTVAYALATAEHETAGTMLPIEEYGGREQARKLGYSGGENYYGRGYIQLTHDYNYKQMGDRIGVPDLAEHPEKALEPETAAKILAAFFKDRGVADAASKGDFIGAREPINGTDQAEKIASMAHKYLSSEPSQKLSAVPAPTLNAAPVPTPTQTPQVTEKPNIVSPFATKRDIEVGYGAPANPYAYPGGRHMATDISGTEGELMMQPAGGIVAENPMTPRWPYGHRMVVVGKSPEEYAQVSEEEKANPYTNPEEDWYAMNHLQAPAINPQTGLPYQVGDYIATGSADLRLGNTGHSSGPHVDMETGKVKNKGDYTKYEDIVKLIKQEIKRLSL